MTRDPAIPLSISILWCVIFFTLLAPASLNPEGLRRTQSEFQAGREEWIEEMRGEVLNFIDFERPQWPGAENVVSVGYRYRLNETDFEEMTYLVTCGTKLYHLTTLLVVSEIPERGGEVRSIVQSFSCR